MEHDEGCEASKVKIFAIQSYRTDMAGGTVKVSTGISLFFSLFIVNSDVSFVRNELNT